MESHDPMPLLEPSSTQDNINAFNWLVVQNKIMNYSPREVIATGMTKLEFTYHELGE